MKRVKLTRETQLAINKLRNKQKLFKLAKENEELDKIVELEREKGYAKQRFWGLERVIPSGSMAKYKATCTCGHQQGSHYARTGSDYPCLAINTTTGNYDCECPNFISKAKRETKEISQQFKTPPAKLIALGRRKIDL